MRVVMFLALVVAGWVFWSTVIKEGEVAMGIVLSICVGLIVFVLLGTALSILRLERLERESPFIGKFPLG